MTPSETTDLQSQCDLLRSLHRPGVSWGLFLYLDAMARFTEQLASLTG